MEESDRVRMSLRAQRLRLLERESAHLARARHLLEQIQGTVARGGDAGGVLREAGRAVALAEEARRLGVIDARRVGASMEDLSRASGLGSEDLETLLFGAA